MADRDLEQLLAILDEHPAAEMSAGVFKAFSRTKSERLATNLLGRWDAVTPAVRRSIIDVLLQRPAWG